MCVSTKITKYKHCVKMGNADLTFTWEEHTTQPKYNEIMKTTHFVEVKPA
jgi:hypothetical protein